MIFASPDWGAGGVIQLFYLIVWAVVLVFVGVGVVLGVKLLGKDARKAKTLGLLLVLVSSMVPLCCWIIPPYMIYLAYGNFPLKSYPTNKISEGMTMNEVKAILGSPHDRYKESNGEIWYYYIGLLGDDFFAITFGPEGRVVHGLPGIVDEAPNRSKKDLEQGELPPVKE